MRYWDISDWLMMVVFPVLIMISLLAFGVGIIAGIQHGDDLMHECMADNHARYQCASILRGGRR